MVTGGMNTIKLVELIHERAIQIMFNGMLFTLDGDTADGVAYKRVMDGTYVRTKFNVDLYEKGELDWQPVELKDMAVEIGKRLFTKDSLWMRYQIHELNGLLSEMNRRQVREMQLQLTSSVANMGEEEVLAFLEMAKKEKEKSEQQEAEAPAEVKEEDLKDLLDKCDGKEQHPEADAGPQGEELI